MFVVSISTIGLITSVMKFELTLTILQSLIILQSKLQRRVYPAILKFGVFGATDVKLLIQLWYDMRCIKPKHNHIQLEEQYVLNINRKRSMLSQYTTSVVKRIHRQPRGAYKQIRSSLRTLSTSARITRILAPNDGSTHGQSLHHRSTRQKSKDC